MPSRAATEYRYEKLTWPEINDAVELGKVCIVPCGAVEQMDTIFHWTWIWSARPKLLVVLESKYRARCWCCRL